MKSHPPKLKTTSSRPLFSCGFFRHCTQTVTSPTTSAPPSLSISSSDPLPPPPPPPLHHHGKPSSSSSSSNSSSTTTSQSFTQWKFPVPPHSPEKTRQPLPPPLSSTDIQELYHVAELQFSSDTDPSDRVRTLTMLEKSLVPNPRAADVACPRAVMGAILTFLAGSDPLGNKGTCAKSATKVLLALCLSEGNRRVAVEEGAAGRVVEALADMEGAVAERALAALELLCTVAEGAAEVRAHALAVPMMVEVMGRMAERGKEYAISVLAVIYGGGEESGIHAPPEAVAGAVTLALQGDCSARGRRKGAQLMKILEENGRSDLNQDGS